MALTLDDVLEELEAEEPDYEALAVRLGPEALVHLAQLARAPDPDIGPKAVYLAALLKGPEAMKILDEASRNQDPLWRAAAAGAAADLPAVDVGPILGRLFNDQDPHVRKEAIASTPLQPGAALEAALTRIVTLDSESWVRDEATKALTRINQARR
jgi:HEAT repeat protein